MCPVGFLHLWGEQKIGQWEHNYTICIPQVSSSFVMMIVKCALWVPLWELFSGMQGLIWIGTMLCAEKGVMPSLPCHFPDMKHTQVNAMYPTGKMFEPPLGEIVPLRAILCQENASHVPVQIGIIVSGNWISRRKLRSMDVLQKIFSWIWILGSWKT